MRVIPASAHKYKYSDQDAQVDPFTQRVVPASPPKRRTSTSTTTTTSSSEHRSYVWYNTEYDPSLDLSSSGVEANEDPVFVTSIENNRKRRATKTLVRLSVGVYFYWVARATLAHLGPLPPLGYLYKAHPIAASFVTCGLKSILADAISQVKTQATSPDVTWNPTGTTGFSFGKRQSLSYILYGSMCLGLGSAVMYTKVMPFLFPTTGLLGGSQVARILAQTCFDNFVCAPLFWLPPAYLIKSLFFPATPWDLYKFEHSTSNFVPFPNNYNHTNKRAKAKHIAKYWSSNFKAGLANYVVDVRENGLLKKYWSLWLPAQMITFSPLVPTHFRSACTAAISFGWLLILMNANGNGNGKASRNQEEA